jgi:hypothetical protein
MRALAKRALELRLADLADSPATVLSEVARFCHLKADTKRVGKIAQLLSKNRAYAYRNSPDLELSAHDWAQRLPPYGY